MITWHVHKSNSQSPGVDSTTISRQDIMIMSGAKPPPKSLIPLTSVDTWWQADNVFKIYISCLMLLVIEQRKVGGSENSGVIQSGSVLCYTLTKTGSLNVGFAITLHWTFKNVRVILQLTSLRKKAAFCCPIFSRYNTWNSFKGTFLSYYDSILWHVHELNSLSTTQDFTTISRRDI